MAQTKEGAERVAAGKIGVSIVEYKRRKSCGEKWCSGCRSWKLIELFPICRAKYDGRGGYCLACGRVKIRKCTKGRVSPMRGKQHTEEARRKQTAAHTGSRNHRWKGGVSPKRKRNKERLMARRAVNHAVEAGRLARPDSLPCMDCGKKAAEYDHHRGYQPLKQRATSARVCGSWLSKRISGLRTWRTT